MSDKINGPRTPLGIPYPTVDALSFLIDDEIRPFFLDERHDLADTNAPKISTGIFVVHDHEVPKDTAEVILGVLGHCWRRDNPTTAEENLVWLDPDTYAGAVLFNWTKANNQPFLVETNYNLPSLSSAPNDKDRQRLAGSTFLSSASARSGAFVVDGGLKDPLKGTYLPAGSRFRVTFRLAPISAANPPAAPWVLGANPEPDTNNRIDCAGAAVFGVRMPQRLYEHLRIARRNGLLGPEAGE